jgi:hypothetical protein
MFAPSNSQSSRDIQHGAVRLSTFSPSPIVRAFARQRQAADDEKEPPEPLDPNGTANDVIIVANNDRVIVGEQLADNLVFWERESVLPQSQLNKLALELLSG